MLGVRNIRHMRQFLEFADNVANAQNLQDQVQVTLTPSNVPKCRRCVYWSWSECCESTTYSKFWCITRSCNFRRSTNFSPVGVNSIGDPGVTYDRLFKSRPKGAVMSGPNVLYGQKSLKIFHSQTLQYHNHNVAVVHSWFVDKIDPKF